MSPPIAINARYHHRLITGVERHADEISKRIHSEKYFIKPIHPLGRIAGHLWEQAILPAKLPHGHILWSPANAGPWIVQNQIITLHDASVFDHPEWFESKFGAWTRLSWRILAKRVKAIITVSNFSRERLIANLKISKDKIHVVHNGVGNPFRPQSETTIENVKRKYNIDKPYFLFTGTIEPRKNLKILIQSWGLAKIKSHQLLIIGNKGKVFAPGSGIPNLPNVRDVELSSLFAGATAFINPSLYEGFGLTILEAMACGTPVLASDIPVFREIYGDSVHNFDPQSPIQIARAICNFIDDKSSQDSLREKGLNLAGKYTWDKAAKNTEKILLDAGDSS